MEVLHYVKKQYSNLSSKDGIVKVDTMLDNETIWMNQSELAKLIDTIKNNISLHMKNIFESGELLGSATVKDFLTVQKGIFAEINFLLNRSPHT
ncbi:MAG TPA: hypothetical protein IAB40_05435 [Candidatus Onthocola stercoravium]|nr:hypothetical protein [Candidatus Onthocola stercoravium]